jgi:hypothetical protein
MKPLRHGERAFSTKEKCSGCGKAFRGTEPLSDGKGKLYHKKCVPQIDHKALKAQVASSFEKLGRKKIRVAIIVDFMGTSMRTAEEEIEDHKKNFTQILKDFDLEFSAPRAVMPNLVADLVIYDFGGVMPGNSLMEDNSREIVKWASDHPSALVVVASSHTFGAYVKPEMEELGLDKVQNVWDYFDGDQDEKIPAWFAEAK